MDWIYKSAMRTLIKLDPSDQVSFVAFALLHTIIEIGEGLKSIGHFRTTERGKIHMNCIDSLESTGIPARSDPGWKALEQLCQ